MPRNTDKDKNEETRRRQQILEAGLALFSRHGIEAVSMNAVAEAAQVGPTTLYKYYKTKEKLVIAISAMVWSKVWQETINRCGAEQFMQASAYDLICIYTDNIIRLYKNCPELLRFSGDYKTFICRQQTNSVELKEHLDPLEPIHESFQKAYIRAQTDHSIRTDVPEDILFSTIALGMLAVAERYAQGIVWADRGVPDHVCELEITREMFLNWCTIGTDKHTYPPEKRNTVQKHCEK